jgi:hypothetical protein
MFFISFSIFHPWHVSGLETIFRRIYQYGQKLLLQCVWSISVHTYNIITITKQCGPNNSVSAVYQLCQHEIYAFQNRIQTPKLHTMHKENICTPRQLSLYILQTGELLSSLVNHLETQQNFSSNNASTHKLTLHFGGAQFESQMVHSLISARVFHGFLHLLEENADTVPSIMPWLLLCIKKSKAIPVPGHEGP